jgi:hypothetical protein
MHLFDELNEENFVLFASRNYNNPQCTSIDEFNDDLLRFKYLKRLFKRYIKDGDLQERLILNHLVVLYNVFGITAANKMMFYKMEDEYWPILKTFLVYLNYIKESELVEIPLNEHIVKTLREL